jgi:hypothetical protein
MTDFSFAFKQDLPLKSGFLPVFTPFFSFAFKQEFGLDQRSAFYLKKMLPYSIVV